jgi:hypothetical protein
VYRSNIDPVLRELIDGREVVWERQPRGARLLWVYSTRPELDVPIVDPERAFREGDEG